MRNPNNKPTKTLIAIIAALTIIAVPLALRSRATNNAHPFVGGHLHAVATWGTLVFVGGHQGAAVHSPAGGWRKITSLDNTDAMAWAKTSRGVFAGGHAGLYQAARGTQFQPSRATLPVTDVHALGAAGTTVYLASPQGGMFVSVDGGRTFSKSSEIGASFMGTIEVDPKNPKRAVAADMQNGAVMTDDGGRTWRRMGGPTGAMSVAWDPTDRQRLVIVAMDGAVETRDGGRTWKNLSVPTGTAAATFDHQGRLIVAALSDVRAAVFRHTAKAWRPLGKAQ